MTKYLRIGHNMSGSNFLYLTEDDHIVKMDDVLAPRIAEITGLSLSKSQGMIPIGMFTELGDLIVLSEASIGKDAIKEALERLKDETVERRLGVKIGWD